MATDSCNGASVGQAGQTSEVTQAAANRRKGVALTPWIPMDAPLYIHHAVLPKEWFSRRMFSMLVREELCMKASCPPQVDIQAARPPAVKSWADFCSRTQAFFESCQWPSTNIEPFLNMIDRCWLEDRNTALTDLKTAVTVLQTYTSIFPALQLQVEETPGPLNTDGDPDSNVMMIKSGDLNLLAVLAFNDLRTGSLEWTDLSKFKEYDHHHSASSEDWTQRLVERVYGHLVSAGVAFGIYVSYWTCTFVCINPKDGGMMISPSLRHNSCDITAKQGLLYLLSLAATQPTVDLKAVVGPRKQVPAQHDNLVKLFRDLKDMRVISIEDAQVGRRIGEGNASEVYEAKMNDITVALKVARVEGAFDKPSLSVSCPERLAQEIRIYENIKALQGNVIPNIHAYGLLENRAGDFLPFLAMDKIDGDTLDKAIPSMPEQGLSCVIRAVVTAYARLHITGFIHGSVKPQNIMIRKSGEAVLVDFGKGETTDDSKIDSERKEIICTLIDVLEDTLHVTRQAAHAKLVQYLGGTTLSAEV